MSYTQKITDLEVMEEVVKSDPFLEWDGWDVVKYTPNPIAFFYADGRFRSGKWYRTARVVPDRNGWDASKLV